MVLVKGLIFYKASFKIKIVKQNVHQAGTYSVCLDPLNPRLRFTSCVFVLFFFSFHAFLSNAVTVYVLYIEQ